MSDHTCRIPWVLTIFTPADELVQQRIEVGNLKHLSRKVGGGGVVGGGGASGVRVCFKLNLSWMKNFFPFFPPGLCW